VFAYDESLRDRVRTNLTGFERHAHAGDGLRPAAVALALLPGDDGVPSFVLTRRAAKLKAHQGQWALPGGRIDSGEAAADAALRELREEVGLELAADTVLGLLDDYPTRSGYCITPVVVWAGAEAQLAPNPDEVAIAYRVALSELDRPDVPRLRTIPETRRPRRSCSSCARSRCAGSPRASRTTSSPCSRGVSPSGTPRSSSR
jgi:8-oxo-dGTP pyrophosphatase MutT (NUDIX family)